ncbi:MAG: ANTAR domain-containing response regulator [Anaerolineae bacterium]
MSQKTRILIADDESIIRMGLQVMLRDLGYQVAGTARDGIEALDMVREKPPDLAILDIKMPRMDGLEAAEAISRERPIPIIILTAFSDREYVERAKSTAVHAYLIKPVREEKLMPAIELAQARFLEQQTLAEEAQSLEEALETRDLLDQAKRLLMDELGIEEAEAFQRIHRQARDSRRSMQSVAQNIIDQHR